MTREQQRMNHEQKQVEKLAAKNQKKEERKELKSWGKMVRVAKSKGAWIEETELTNY
jgi:hypothetical protein